MRRSVEVRDCIYRPPQLRVPQAALTFIEKQGSVELVLLIHIVT